MNAALIGRALQRPSRSAGRHKAAEIDYTKGTFPLERLARHTPRKSVRAAASPFAGILDTSGARSSSSLHTPAGKASQDYPKTSDRPGMFQSHPSQGLTGDI